LDSPLPFWSAFSLKHRGIFHYCVFFHFKISRCFHSLCLPHPPRSPFFCSVTSFQPLLILDDRLFFNCLPCVLDVLCPADAVLFLDFLPALSFFSMWQSSSCLASPFCLLFGDRSSFLTVRGPAVALSRLFALFSDQHKLSDLISRCLSHDRLLEVFP